MSTSEKTLTGYPSIDKPWLKYYPEGAQDISIPEKTAYKFIYDKQKENTKKIALKYLGRKITYVACGRQDAYFEYNLKPWDFAAGYLLVQEAGGIVKGADLDEIIHGKNANIVACCNETLMNELFEII